MAVTGLILIREESIKKPRTVNSEQLTIGVGIVYPTPTQLTELTHSEKKPL